MPRSFDQLLTAASQLPPIWNKDAWSNPQLDNPWPEVVELMCIDASEIKPGFSDLSEIASDWLSGDLHSHVLILRYKLQLHDFYKLESLWEKYKPFLAYID
jgi:hypothetical protein